jgi:peptidoglycan/LPS O-acetylase OafA/YrhL
MAGDAYVVLARITGMANGAAIAAVCVLLALLGCWYAWPFADRWRRARGRQVQELQQAKQA